jgi:hypothetical protein
MAIIADEILAHVASPLELEPSGVPSEVPMAPQLLGPFEESTSTSIHSIHGSPNHGFRQDPTHNDMAAPSLLPLRKAGKTATMNSGPPSVLHNPQPSQTSIVMERESSRPGSASSTRTTKSSKQDNALVQLSFEGKGSHESKINGYTEAGRHGDDWLFGGFSVSDSVKKFLKRDKKSG